MRCTGYCTAENYQLNKVSDYFKKKNFQTRLYRNVLYLLAPNKQDEIFVFALGCFVSWGLTSKEENDFAREIQTFAINPIPKVEIDRFIFSYGNRTSLQTHDRFNADIIMLEDDDVQIKLAISYGIAQSVKLEYYEESVQSTIRKNHSLPSELAHKGRISLSGKSISKRMGELFLERASVNLSSEYLDMPEYFWQFPRLESYYIMTEKFLDISRRVNSLNQRLDVLHGLFDMLTTQLQHRHSSLLEWIIILLIFIEIVMTLLPMHLGH
jgi:uncharacterized Rmd1/YagE family protein